MKRCNSYDVKFELCVRSKFNSQFGAPHPLTFAQGPHHVNVVYMKATSGTEKIVFLIVQILWIEEHVQNLLLS